MPLGIPRLEDARSERDRLVYEARHLRPFSDFKEQLREESRNWRRNDFVHSLIESAKLSRDGEWSDSGWGSFAPSSTVCRQLQSAPQSPSPASIPSASPRRRGRPAMRLPADPGAFKRLRIEPGYSQADFSDKCGISLSTLRRVERAGGQVSRETLKKVVEFARKVLHVRISPDELLLTDPCTKDVPGSTDLAL